MAGLDKKLNFTPEQEAAIFYRGGSLLVSAAAGSGKTRVLVERLLSYVEEFNDIDEFLVITYTRAAAAELRERIYEEISARLADASGAESFGTHMWRQFMLCRSAQIGTIHSFCTDILRENAHLAGVMPDFRVADENENAIIKADVLENVLDQAYESAKTSDGFYNLVDSISPGRDDRRLFEIILDAYAKLMSCPDLNDWVARQIKRLELSGVQDVADTIWGEYLIKSADATARFWHGEMLSLLREIGNYADFHAAYGSSVEQTARSIEEFISALSTSWDKARDFGQVEFPRPKNVKSFEELKDVRKRCKKAMDKCTAVFEYSSGELLGDMRALAPELVALLNLIIEFDRAYKAEKLRRGVVDFSDLEHLCLSLLVDKETGEATALAKSISGRYKEILVDEYQDVNAVQEMIMSAISHNGDNVFMVGDVKQSIYRFRLADPSIFLEKYRRFDEFNSESCLELVSQFSEVSGVRRGLRVEARNDGNGSGVRIHLSKNFRSRVGVLDAVNQVFASVMSVEFGEMDYTEREFLVAGRREEAPVIAGLTRKPLWFPDPIGGCGSGAAMTSNCAAEINVIDLSAFESDDGEDSVSKIQAEARFIAGRIKELAGGGQMGSDKAVVGNAFSYSDIVILMRSICNKAWQYAAALAELGIPSDMPGGEGYYETIEISVALSILKVVDNPMQDIPLVAALRSPVYGFDADELAEIRVCSPHKDFYTALTVAAETNGKCREFLSEIESLRALAPDMPADRFIWHMYNKTGLLARVGAMRHGEQRRENLILLAENARSYEQSGYKGLFGFLTYICSQQERAIEPIREVSLSEQNAVRIMSIHKSKGLEFPMVFIAGTTSKMNNKDALQPLLIHSEFGIGSKRTDLERRIKFTTLSRDAIQRKLTLENMAEELRVLYVAMTRAKERLFVVAAFNNAEREMDKYTKLARGFHSEGSLSPEPGQTRKIAPQLLMDINNMAGWVLMAALAGEGRELRVERGELREESGERREERGELRMENGELVDNSEFRIPNSEFIEPCLCELIERFTFVYPFEHAVDMPSKLTVTELKGKFSSVETDDEAASLVPVRKNVSGTSAKSLKYAFERPEFVIKKIGMTGVERGTALHLVMQYIDLKAYMNISEIVQEVKALLDKGFLTQEQADAVDIQKIMLFFESDIGKRLLQAREIKREFKFSLLYDAKRFFPDYVPRLDSDSADEILVQGVVDCFFEENGELVVLDFKTDYVTEETIDEKVSQYKQQITAYAEALERITGKCVKERAIYFFELDKECVV